jgi:tRNA U34 5-methylaminomethyl-2-thiouridine-forming methyltransferase MnmC
LKRTLLKTADGSYTLQIPEWDEQYHSKHGAIAEALHVFIKEGLLFWFENNAVKEVSILEIGFGTGLNSYLSFLQTINNAWTINYTGVEAYPLSIEEVKTLEYPASLNSPEVDFLKLHKVPWEANSIISENFQLTKQKKKFSEIHDQNTYDLIYFDAFGIRVQPELWTEEIFRIMFGALRPNGILVTYAANGNARRALIAAGFEVKRLPGPPGKKEMMRATKLKF